MGQKTWGFVDQGADFWNLDPLALRQYSEDLAELIDRAQSAIAIAVVTEASVAGIYAVKPITVTLTARPERARAWLTSDKKNGVMCFCVELSDYKGGPFRDALSFVPTPLRP